MTDKQLLNLLIAYIIIGFLTYGYLYNNPLPCEREFTASCDIDNQMRPLMGSLFWPIYFTSRFAIWIFS